MIRVLITDDQPHIRQGLHMLLSIIPGLEVAGEAKSGEEAIQKAFSLRPDLLIIDARMPGMGGISAIAHIKRLLPEAVVIVISIEGERLRERSLAAGAFAFVEKGSGQSALLLEVKRAAEFLKDRQG